MPKLKVVIVLLALIQCKVLAHFFMVTPIARSTDPGLKSYPCGGIGPGTQITTIAPGNFTVVWEETISHTGAPYVIAISYGDDNHPLLLADNIPNNPLGATPKKYAFTIVIPDIACDKCTLEMYNPMTDSLPSGTTCTYPPGSANQCLAVYHACADIKISGKGDVQNFANNYKFQYPSCWVQNPTPIQGNYGRVLGKYVPDNNNVYTLNFRDTFGCDENNNPNYPNPFVNQSGAVAAGILVPIAIVSVAGVVYFFKEKRAQGK